MVPLHFLVFLLDQLASCDRVVHTNSGPVRGKTVASGNVEAYLGIPYAEPPVGHLRFAKPVPRAAWAEVLDATQKHPACMQMDLRLPVPLSGTSEKTEDCLYLNLWVPNSGTEDSGPKAIMFFIHGGGFMIGTASWDILDGAKLAERGDVIVVTINYRVGALGFFAGYTEDAPGNQGLHDQILALRWVRDNAHHFNGDPDRITIFGESAGSFSVSLLQLSPVSRPLFRYYMIEDSLEVSHVIKQGTREYTRSIPTGDNKRAILQSGSAVNPLYNVQNADVNKINAKYIRHLGCTSDGGASNNQQENPERILDCMRNFPAEAYAEADTSAFEENGSILMFPRFGEELFPDSAVSMFREGQFKNSEVLMGVTRDEGMFGFFLSDPSLFKTVDGADLFNRSTAYDAIRWTQLSRMMLEATSQEEMEKIIQGYLDDVTDDSGYTYLKAVSDAVGDSLITCGNVFQAEFQAARGVPVYFYLFDHQMTNSPYPKWFGVPHGAEMTFVFGNLFHGSFTEEEKELSQDIMDMWSGFAKTGNPSLPKGLQWPLFTKEDPKYYVISRRDRVETGPDNHRCERWRDLFLNSQQSNSNLI